MQPVNEIDFAAVTPGTYLIPAGADIGHLAWSLCTHGWRPLLIERHTAGDKQALLGAFAIGLGFPDWFGHNWDALVDLLRTWSNYQPLAVVIADMGVSQPAATDELATVATLTDIFDQLVVEGQPVKLGVVPTA